jgi:tyrosyl-tRNA synthetase
MVLKSSFLNEAVARGFFYQATDLDAMDEYLSVKGRYGYVGFDITAKSLHVGSFIPIALMRLFQKHGHHPVLLVGGGTTKIGDPSFRNVMRPLLSDEEISSNMSGIKSCLLPFLNFESENKALLVNNADWLDNIQYIPFLRDIGKFFSINRMIGFDSVKSKLEANNSLSFLEFNYMLLQAYDYYELFRNMDCRIQFGGQDQWGNIVCGVELIKKKLGMDAFGFTSPLLVTKDGKKMGKTATGAVWLSRDMYSAYDFWQYWRNVDDADVIKLIYLFTDFSLDEIKKMESVRGQELNALKIMLADEITSLVHGKDSLKSIHTSADGVFNEECSDFSEASSIPKYYMKQSDVNSKSVIDVLVESNLCDSRSDAKRLLRQGGVYINNATVDESYKFPSDSNGILKLSSGKKKHLLIVIE